MFQSNSGSRKFLSTTISLAESLPAKVFDCLSLLSTFGTIACGNADLLVQHPIEPESNETRKGFLPRIVPTLFALQIVID